MRYHAIEIVELSPRDGLQNEEMVFSVLHKVALIERMVAAGARQIDIPNFVRADRVPQMADAEAMIAAARLPADLVTIELMMNKNGLFRALETTIRKIGAVCVASDSFAARKQGQASAGSMAIANGIVRIARAEGRRAQVTIGAAFGCRFEGAVDPAHVVIKTRRLAEAGPIKIALADTIGVVVPQKVSTLLTRLRAAVGDIAVRVHLHNMRGSGIANAWAAVEAGA